MLDGPALTGIKLQALARRAVAVRIMKQRRIRRLPVLDQTRRKVGMLSLGDVAHGASHEISGETQTAVSAHHM